MRHRFEEYFAKYILEKCFLEKFVELTVKDRPDLWCKNHIGIEVTNCMPKEAVEAAHLWDIISKNGTKNQERNIERLKQLGMEYNGGSFVWDQGWYSPNIDESPIKLFLNAVESKVERLNSPTAHYAPMDSYELFVNSFIFIPMGQMHIVVKRLKTINSKSKKFDTIYLLTNEQKLVVFDMKNDMQYELFVGDKLSFWANFAFRIYVGEKNNDKT